MDWPFTSSQLTDAIAGGLGGAVKAMALELPVKQSVVSVTVGAICSLYLTPVTNAVFKPTLGVFVPIDAVIGFSGFVTGVIGVAFVGFFLGMFKIWCEQRQSP
jgi:hypothetical protein